MRSRGAIFVSSHLSNANPGLLKVSRLSLIFTAELDMCIRASEMPQEVRTARHILPSRSYEI
jgi:hypothetical protein